MTTYTNAFKRMDTDEVVREFTCTCPPDSGSHERMVRGALRNANLEEYWLDDGNPVLEPEPQQQP